MPEFTEEEQFKYKQRSGVAASLKKVNSDLEGYSAITGGGVIGMSLPGSFKPFSGAEFPWNHNFVTGAQDWGSVHSNSANMIEAARQKSLAGGGNGNVRFSDNNCIPIWNVNSTLLTGWRAHSSGNIYTTWDADKNDISDVTFPYESPTMWWETTSDAHIIIVDLILNKSWELSKMLVPCSLDGGSPNATHAKCGTFNIWDIGSNPLHDGMQAQPWAGYPDIHLIHGNQSRGGRGGGTPVIGGLLRPEEVKSGTISHAMCFTYEGLRVTGGDSKVYLWPPCCRADTDPSGPVPQSQTGPQWMYYGTRIRLDPDKTVADFVALVPQGQTANMNVWTVLRCLQDYGAYAVDYGDDGIKFQRQMLSNQGSTADRNAWNSASMCGANFIEQMRLIPTAWFQVYDSPNNQTLYTLTDW